MNLQEARELVKSPDTIWDMSLQMYRVSYEGMKYSGLTESELISNLMSKRTIECWPSGSTEEGGDGEGEATEELVDEAKELPEDDIADGAFGGEGIASGPESFKVSTIDITRPRKAYGGPQPHVTEARSIRPPAPGDEQYDRPNVPEPDEEPLGPDYHDFFNDDPRFVDKEAELGRPLRPDEFPDHDNSAYIDAMAEFEDEQMAERGRQYCNSCDEECSLGGVCPHCGHDNNEDNDCPHCGESLTKSTTEHGNLLESTSNIMIERPNYQPNTLKEDCRAQDSFLPTSVLKKLGESKRNLQESGSDNFGGKKAPPFGKKDSDDSGDSDDSKCCTTCNCDPCTCDSGDSKTDDDESSGKPWESTAGISFNNVIEDCGWEDEEEDDLCQSKSKTESEESNLKEMKKPPVLRPIEDPSYQETIRNAIENDTGWWVDGTDELYYKYAQQLDPGDYAEAPEDGLYIMAGDLPEDSFGVVRKNELDNAINY